MRMLLKAGDRIIMTKRMVGAESLLGKEFNIIDVAKSYDNSCETEYLEKKENLKLRIAINNSLKGFTPLQKKIWDSRAQEESEYNFVKMNKKRHKCRTNMNCFSENFFFERNKVFF